MFRTIKLEWTLMSFLLIYFVIFSVKQSLQIVLLLQMEMEMAFHVYVEISANLFLTEIRLDWI